MKQAILSTALLLTTLLSFAQNDSVVEVKKHAPSIATVHTMEGQTVKGWFYRIDDDHVILLPSKIKHFSLTSLKNPNINDNTTTINVEQIRSISLHKKNSVLKGGLIGLGIGVLGGVIIGLASGDDPVQTYPPVGQDPYGIGNFLTGLNNSLAMTAGEKALYGALGFGALDAVVGMFIGAIAKRKFKIGGKKAVFRDMQGDLMKRLIVQ
jgi:hypothetical protein